jgi:peptidoglycan glycosyltransferase
MLPDPKDLAPVVVAWGFSLVVIIFEKDLGSALLFFVLFISMLWIATGRLSYLGVGMGLFSGGAYLSWLFFDHVQTRVTLWLDPWNDPKRYQILQASYAFAWGGVGGTGLGLGLAKSLPEKESDFIFAVIGEELGLVVAFLLVIGAGLRVAVRLHDPFAKLLAAGLTTLLGFQSFLIMGGVTRLLPLTGVTLPFISYGGSSLVSNWIVIALLVRLSHEAATAHAPPADDGDMTSVIQVPR